MKLIREAITEHWGERCAEYDAECACCQAWAEYDSLIDSVLEAAFPLNGHIVTPVVWEYPQ